MTTRIVTPLLAMILVATACQTAALEPEGVSTAAAIEATTLPISDDETAIDSEESSEVVEPISRDPLLPLIALYDVLDLSESQHFAKEMGIQQCLNRRGWEYSPAPYIPTRPVERRYGIVDEQAAALYGYSSPPDNREVPLFNSAQNAYYFSLSMADQLAFSDAMAGEGYGDGEIRHIYLDGVLIASGLTSGCYTEAWETRIGDFVAWVQLDRWLQNLMHESFTLAESDPRVQEAQSLWRACMESEGHSVTSLTVPPFDEPGNDVAVSDARCNNASALAATWMQVESEFQYALIDEHGAKLGAMLLSTGVVESLPVVLGGSS